MPLVDIESSIFSPIAAEFDGMYPDGYRGTEPVDAPARFPCLVLYEADRYFSGYSGLDSKRVVIDVDAFSDLTSGAKSQCKAIIAMVERKLSEIGPWEQVFCNPIGNAESKIFRVRARYRATAVQESNVDGDVTVRIYRK